MSAKGDGRSVQGPRGRCRAVGWRAGLAVAALVGLTTWTGCDVAAPVGSRAPADFRGDVLEPGEVAGWIGRQAGEAVLVTMPSNGSRAEALASLTDFADEHPNLRVAFAVDPDGDATDVLGGQAAPAVAVVRGGKVVTAATGAPAPLRLRWVYRRAEAAPTSAPEPDGQGVVYADDTNFTDAIVATDRVVLVDFWAPWCGPCRQLNPELIALKRDLGEKVEIVKVDVDQSPRTAGRFQVSSIPHVFAIREGEILDDRTGLQSRAELAAWVRGLP